LAKDGKLLSAEERDTLDEARRRLEAAIAGEDRDEINAAGEALEALSKPFAERRMDRGIREALSGLSMSDLERRVGE
jgi:molecular chaperone HscA